MKKLYSNYKSPIGNILIECSQNQILSISLKKKTLSNSDSPYIKKIKSYFDQYFLGNTDIFSELKWNEFHLTGTDFQVNVWKELFKLNGSKTTTYSQIANNIKSPKAYRAVGSAVGKNPFFLILPCHRVLGKNKTLNGFAYGIPVKEFLLEHENLEFIS